MFRIIARLLPPYALLFVLSIGLLAGTAHAQLTFPTPSKTFLAREYFTGRRFMTCTPSTRY